MRTDQPWLMIAARVRRALAPRVAKGMPLIESEVPPGRLLFGHGRGNRLALLGAMFGLAGAGATLTSTAYRNANVPAVTAPELSGDDCGIGDIVFLIPGCFPSWTLIQGPDLYAVLPPGRRRDSAWRES